VGSIQIDISKIIIKDRSRKDFGDIQELAESIKEHGIIQPIAITPDNILIAGERRIKACKTLGLSQIEAYVMNASEYEIKYLERDENELHKAFTPSERVEIARDIEVVEKLKAEERQKSTQIIHGAAPRSITVEGEKGVAKDIAAKKAGLGSRATYDRAKAVVDSGNKELIEKMDKGEISIRKAHDTLKEESKVTPKPNELENNIESEVKDTDVKTKTCSECKKEFPVTEFYKGKGKCKPCLNSIHRYNKSELFDVSTDTLEKMIEEMKGPSLKTPDEGQKKTYSIFSISQFESTINNVLLMINPYSNMITDLKNLTEYDKHLTLSLIEQVNNNIVKIKNTISGGN